MAETYATHTSTTSENGHRVINKQFFRFGKHCCVVLYVGTPFILDVRFVDVPVGVTLEESHTGFLIHLPSAVLALNFLARRIQPFLSLVDREVKFCVL